jgi:AAA+ superfamily predicted ATPase
MLAAARFAALIESLEHGRAMRTPGTVTLIEVPDVDLRRHLQARLPIVLRMMPTEPPLGESWDDITVVAYLTQNSDTPRDRARQSRSFHDDLDAVIGEKGDAVLALAGAPDELSASGEMLCDRRLPFPGIAQWMIVEILRATHSETGELAADRLRQILPDDVALNGLPLPVIQAAFWGTSTIDVAQRLAAAAERRVRQVRSGLTLDDVALPAPLREDLQSMADDLQEWMVGGLDWSEVTSSVFIDGAPGTGKSRTAEALAGSARAHLVVTSYSDCQRHGHQGDMLKALNEKVGEAIRSTPSVLFIDEMEAFSNRSSASRRSDYIVGVVNGLLEQLNILAQTPGVIVIGAANAKHLIDPAILRSGRFDLHHTLGLPDLTALRDILRVHLGADARALDIDSVAERLTGRSGAATGGLA